MSNYRRAWHKGGTYFFTVNLLQRKENDLLVRHIDFLRDAVRQTIKSHPFTIHGWVVLPDHLHCVMTLPIGDSDFALRWRLIKSRFSKTIPDKEWRSDIRKKRGERGVWQRRYWEHLIRDEKDFTAHMDYVHINPLKHGLVKQVCDWPFSTFHRLVQDGVYPIDWAGGSSEIPEYVDY
ncbi:REP-associated tyrosine transposase [Solimicrobium silvestre]|uniref:Transposase n=1 Tax=Solimicrobium silvestre TaxID=2099400 RepID=A0A2S9GT14_9BURK|nr:transposase [Solimicrobium silvestre]PRC90836.1 Transposase [Solimicrobium silvestre]